MPLFHRKESSTIPFLLLDPHRGLFLFDSVSWRFDGLRSAKAVDARSADARQPAVNVDNPHTCITRKFNELLFTDACEIVNFLYLEHLSLSEFEQLDSSFHALLPEKRLIFADDTPETIETKLSDALPRLDKPLETPQLLGALFLQYLVLPDKLQSEHALLSREQRRYIETELPKRTLLHGSYGSGKTTLILLKAIYEKLQNPGASIAIIEPTLAACEFLKQQLLQIIEYAIADLDPTAIRIMTPEQLSSSHYRKLYKKAPRHAAEITDKMLSKAYDVADIVFCDDANLLEGTFLKYLEHLQRGKALHYASVKIYPDISETFSIPHSFRCPHSLIRYCDDRQTPVQNDTLQIMEGNGFIHTLHTLSKLLDSVNEDELMIIVPDKAYAASLQEEIVDYVDIPVSLFNGDEMLLYQEIDHLLIAPVKELSGLQRKHVIVIADNSVDDPWLSHALSRAYRSAHLIFDHGSNEEETPSQRSHSEA